MRSKVGYRDGRRQWLWEPPLVPCPPEPWPEGDRGLAADDEWGGINAEAGAVLEREQLEWAKDLAQRARE